MENQFSSGNMLTVTHHAYNETCALWWDEAMERLLQTLGEDARASAAVCTV
jgi:hypothetical protein